MDGVAGVTVNGSVLGYITLLELLSGHHTAGKRPYVSWDVRLGVVPLRGCAMAKIYEQCWSSRPESQIIELNICLKAWTMPASTYHMWDPLLPDFDHPTNLVSVYQTCCWCWTCSLISG